MRIQTVPAFGEAHQWTKNMTVEMRKFLPPIEQRQWQIAGGDLFFNQEGSQVKVEVGSWLVKLENGGSNISIVSDRNYTQQYEAAPEQKKPAPKKKTPKKKKPGRRTVN